MPILDTTDSSLVQRYSEFVESSPWGTFLQAIAWSEVKDNWDSDYIYLEDDESGQIRGALSILSISNDGEHAFLYAPRGPVCDPADIDTVRELIEEAEAVAHARNAFLLRMDPAVEYSDDLAELYSNQDGIALRSRTVATNEGEKVFSNPRRNMILSIEGRSLEDIIASYPRKFRYQIRRTYKDGLATRRIQFHDEEFERALDTFYDLTVQMTERKGITHRPKDYFRRLMNAFADSATMLETYDETGEVLSSCIVITYNDTASYLYAASSDNKRHLQPSVQMTTEAIGLTIEKGLDHFDFGGVYGFDASDGLYLYKSKYTGAEGLHEYLGEIDVVYNAAIYRDFI
ncbi:MAG: peptidoglycan bridge formation glycyltransferase FemA/FemB family protein [Actinomycetaceae bacterium]|nr:peptidoglycan bridge formation glycyltransferase FemA/FemB family protein [Actinomycetaceae bacterium]